MGEGNFEKPEKIKSGKKVRNSFLEQRQSKNRKKGKGGKRKHTIKISKRRIND